MPKFQNLNFFFKKILSILLSSYYFFNKKSFIKVLKYLTYLSSFLFNKKYKNMTIFKIFIIEKIIIKSDKVNN